MMRRLVFMCVAVLACSGVTLAAQPTCPQQYITVQAPAPMRYVDTPCILGSTGTNPMEGCLNCSGVMVFVPQPDGSSAQACRRRVPQYLTVTQRLVPGCVPSSLTFRKPVLPRRIAPAQGLTAVTPAQPMARPMPIMRPMPIVRPMPIMRPMSAVPMRAPGSGRVPY